MNTAATRITKNGKEGEDLSAICAKSARKDNIKFNPNHVHWCTKSGSNSPEKNPTLVTQDTVHSEFQEHKELLKFLVPHLASLPLITFTLPAEDLASLALSSAILYKNANEKYTRTKYTCTLPLSVPRLDFELQASHRLKKKAEF